MYLKIDPEADNLTTEEEIQISDDTKSFILETIKTLAKHEMSGADLESGAETQKGLS
jgi:hypothetical protein